MMVSKNNYCQKKLALSILGVGICLLLLPLKTNLLISKTDSLKPKVYLLIKGKNFTKEDLVGISNFKTKYTIDKHFTKQVVGVSGDVIKVIENKVYLNGRLKAITKTKTKHNEQLTPIRSQIIPINYYFVLAEHKDSFDSRYQEFGLVKDEYIEGKAIPLW